MAQHYLLYGHGGSLNHGGEAIVRTTIAFLRRISPECYITLSTHFAQQDKTFKIDADEIIERDQHGSTDEETYAPTWKRIQSNSVCIHLGGDNYCYPNWKRYAMIHYKALERGAASILWGCSIEPSSIDSEMLDVLRSHHLVAARECITFQALIEFGLSNVVKVSDIAFSLPSEHVHFSLKNFVAVNFSPLIIRKNPLVEAAFKKLVNYLIDETDMSVALIPHVVALADNDYEALGKIEVGTPDRMVRISDTLSAGQYKYIIGKARFGVVARTHAAIAGYSSLVPTLAVGYSAKARGIASDLSMSDYVLDVGQINSDKDVVNAFKKLKDNELCVRKSLEQQIPPYEKQIVAERVVRFLREWEALNG